MKQIYFTVIAAIFSFCTIAQDLPKPSPSAAVHQRIGLTDISIEYSRPSKKDRSVFGGLVPYNQLWRAGANKATKLSTSTDLMIGGKKLLAGDYSLFILPSENEQWKVTLNSELELYGTGDLDESKNVVTFDAKAVKGSNLLETMEYRFINITMTDGELIMNWENTILSISIEVDPLPMAKKNIASALKESAPEDKWKIYRNAASYARDAELTVLGLKWIENSINLKDGWYSQWILAALLAQDKDFKGAIAAGQRAIEMGIKSYEGKTFPYSIRIENDINQWGANL
jgi:hypothetical protein